MSCPSKIQATTRDILGPLPHGSRLMRLASIQKTRGKPKVSLENSLQMMAFRFPHLRLRLEFSFCWKNRAFNDKIHKDVVKKKWSIYRMVGSWIDIWSFRESWYFCPNDSSGWFGLGSYRRVPEGHRPMHRDPPGDPWRPEPGDHGSGKSHIFRRFYCGMSHIKTTIQMMYDMPFLAWIRIMIHH